MNGAIAAGHPLTAEAGARVLAEGGNAVDACVAAAFASWVAESPLTGPGAGGFMLVHRARDRSDRLLDFFVAVPGLGARPPVRGGMEAIDIDFDGDTTQVFRIGAASCAVPGATAGLEAAHRAFGTLPWPRLFEPALELARNGVELTRAQAYLHAILDLILRHTEEGRRIYGRRKRPGPGDRLVLDDLGTTLEELARKGAGAIYGGSLGKEIVRHLRAEGGAVTNADLAAFRVVRRRPVRARFRGHEFVSNPPPSSGGVLIGYGLRLVDALGPPAEPGTAAAMARLAEVMREQGRAREGSFVSELYRGGLAKRLYGEPNMRAALRRGRGGLAGVPERGGRGAAPISLVDARGNAPPPARPTRPRGGGLAGVPERGARGTTHISVVDAGGNAASLTCSTGSGSGVFVPGTGIQMNNMLGEYDLNPGGDPRPGTRLTSMMAPSVVLRRGSPPLVVGSAGSVRLRGAIMQAGGNRVGHGVHGEGGPVAPPLPLQEAHGPRGGG